MEISRVFQGRTRFGRSLPVSFECGEWAEVGVAPEGFEFLFVFGGGVLVGYQEVICTLNCTVFVAGTGER